MARPENAMQVFSLLDKSNCRKCGAKTCLAFAGAVFQGRRSINECPTIDRQAAEKYLPDSDKLSRPAREAPDELFEQLKQEAAAIDLQAAARRIGGVYDGNLLTIKILGKNFSIDREANLISDIHMIPWVTVPFLTYLLKCRGTPLTGEWLSMRELSDGKERYPLFQKRCEEVMQRIGDVYTELFEDMVHLFQGREVESPFDSDISVVLPVLPLVPLLICYWKDDEGMGSSLNVFFDRSLDENLDSETAFTIGAGLTQMFENLALRHGYAVNTS